MKKICALLIAAMMLLTACTAQPGSSTAGSSGRTDAPETSGGTETAESTESVPETEPPILNEIIVWTFSGEEERTKTLCEYYIGRPQLTVPVPEGGWTVTVKTVAPEDLISRMTEATDTSFSEGVLPDIEEMPDLFFFYSDDFDVLQQAGMLSPVPETAAEALGKKIVPSALAAASAGSTVSAYPAALNNTLLLYYDKNVVSETGDLASVIGQCEEKSLGFYVGSETTPFSATMFLSCGLTYAPVVLPDGRVKQVNCDYYTKKGLKAAKLMQVLMSRDGFRAVEGSPVLAFSDLQSQAGAMIADSYQTAEIKTQLGDNCGVAALPPVSDGTAEIPLLSRGTFTLIGVAPKKDDAKRELCHLLAEELVSVGAQRARFEAGGAVPVRESLLKEDMLADNETASALAAQMPNVIRKIRVSPGYYGAMESFTAKLLAGGADMKTAKLQQLLDELSAFLMAEAAKEQE